MEDLLRALASKLRSRRQSQPVSARLTLFVREKVNEQLEKDTDYRCHGDRRGSIRKRKRSFAGKLARSNPRDSRKSRERGHRSGESRVGKECVSTVRKRWTAKP